MILKQVQDMMLGDKKRLFTKLSKLKLAAGGFKVAGYRP